MPTTVDGFTYPANSPLANSHELISELLQEAKLATGSVFYQWTFKPNSSAAGKQLLTGEHADQVAAVSAALEQMLFFARPQQNDTLGIELLRFSGMDVQGWWNRHRGQLETQYQLVGGLKKLISLLLKRSLALTEEHVTQLLILLRMAAVDQYEQGIPFASSLGAIERYVAEHGMSKQMILVAETVIQALKEPRGLWYHGETAAERQHRQRLEKLIPGKSKLLIKAGEAWSDRALADLSELPQPQQNAWAVLISHCLTATTSKPTKKFIKYAEELLHPIGEAEYLRLMNVWIPLFSQPRRIPLPRVDAWDIVDPLLIENEHEDLWKGLAWTFAVYENPELTKLLGDLASHMYYKIPGYGARAAKVGNACVNVLGMKSDTEAVVQLERLKSKVKKPSMKKQIEKAIEAAAEHRGLSTADLAEISVPTVGFNEIGVADFPLGEFIAHSQIVNSRTIHTEYRKADGKVQKSIPKAVKTEFAEQIESLKENLKEATKLLQVHRLRFEQSYLTDRSWTFANWKERFFDHPLLGWLTRRLIWEIDRGNSEERFAIQHEQYVDAESKQIVTPHENDLIKLWHPIYSGTQEIQAWRNWLHATTTQQPFKQAHREVYRLSQEAQHSQTASQRMSGHILRQGQFIALCEDRSWKYRVQGPWDSQNSPTRELPEHALRAEFSVEPASGETGFSGIFDYLVTQQVQFYRTHSHAPLPLLDVPEVIFSEILRDIALFVSVASVGNDPNWTERNSSSPFTPYWRQYAFGELTHSAQTRHDVLEMVLPRLKIASQCSLKGQFLIVKGELRTYQIHLGSGHVLMEPDDEYLCIPAPSVSLAKTANIQLPFEDDSTLGLILEHAFLLANDKSIKDETLLDQISP